MSPNKSRGRPPVAGEKAQKFTTSLYAEDIADLDTLSARWRVSRPNVIRALVRHVLYGTPLPTSKDTPTN